MVHEFKVHKNYAWALIQWIIWTSYIYATFVTV